MTHRIVLACLAAACAIAPLFTPVTASARAGASGGGFHGGFRGGFRAPVFHAARPALSHFPARVGHFRRAPFGERRFARFSAWPGFGSFDPYYFDPYYYYPSDYAAAGVADPNIDPANQGAPSARPRERVMVYTPGCRTQTQTVRAENGGERTVNITRCY
jgi:hypothetical protein